MRHRPAHLRFPGRVLRLASAVSLACWAGTTPADILYWDPGGQAAGTGGAGTWDTTSSFWSTSAQGVPSSGRPSVWQDGAAHTAGFGGKSGEVSISGVRTAGQLVFDTTGYSIVGGRLILGDPNDPSGSGTIRLMDGVSAKLTTALGPRPTGAGTGAGGSTPTEPGHIEILGSGTLTLALTESFAGTLSADSARIETMSDNVSGAMLVLRGTTQQFVPLSGLATRIGGIQTSAPHHFGSVLVIELAGVSNPAMASSFLGGLSAAGLRVGVERFATLTLGAVRSAKLTLGGEQSAPPRVDLGFLAIVDGDVTVRGAEVRLVPGSDGAVPSTEPSLTIGGGSSLTVSGLESSVDAQGTAEVLKDGRLEVTDGGVLHVSLHRIPGAIRVSLLSIGSDSSRAELMVSGAGSQVIVDDTLQLGSKSGANARVRVGGGAELVASTLAFASNLNSATTTQLVIGNHGTARFRQIDTTLAKGDAGTITIQGGTLTIGDESISGLDVRKDYSFQGVLEGGSGLLTKLGSSVLGLYGETGLFAGRVSVEGGELKVAPRTLARATLSVSGGSRFSVPFPDTTLTVGALDGQFDLDLPGTSLALEGDGNGSWRGRVSRDGITVSKTLGTGVQSFEGAIDGSLMSLAQLDVRSAAVRFVGGQFLVEDDADIGRLQAFDPGRSIDMTDGARVTVNGDVTLSNGAALRMRGAGTRLDVIEVNPRKGGGVALGGTVRVSDEAILRAQDLFIPTAGVSGGTSTLTVDSGGAVFADVLGEATTGNRSTLVLTVDGGAMTVGRVLLAPLEAGTRVMSLSDPLTGEPALTVGLDRQGRAVAGDSHLGTLRDATGGPGSVRMAGLGTLTFDGPLGITGELVVDAGRVKPADGADLASVLVRLGHDDALDLTALPSDATLSFAALAGKGDLDIGARRNLTLDSADRTGLYDGHLQIRGVLAKSGAGTQVLAGNADVGHLDVRGGVLEIRGGTTRVGTAASEAVNVRPGRLTDAGLRVTAGGWLDAGALGTVALSPNPRAAELAVTGTGSRLTAGRLVVDDRRGTVSFADGAHMDLTSGFELADGATLEVSRATLITGPEVRLGAKASISLSDPLPTERQDVFSAPVAWTVRPYRNLAVGSGPLSWDVPVHDGVAGPGSLAFTGNDATVMLGSAPAHTGRTMVSGGGMVLVLPAAVAAQQLVAMNGGTIRFAGDVFTSSSTQSFHTDATGIVQWGGVALNGGTLVGRGHRVDGVAATFTNTSLAPGSRLTSTASIQWNGGSLEGELVTRGAAALADFRIRAGGSASLDGSFKLRSATNEGTLRISPGSSATLETAMLLPSGSLLEIADGATIGGEVVQLSGGRLVNHGAVTSTVVVNAGSRAGGDGTFEVVRVLGGTFAPGNSPGHTIASRATLGAAGHYEVEIADATGAAGVGFDLWSVLGRAQFLAGEGEPPFVFDLVSLASDGTRGIAAHFDASRSWRWTVFEAGAFVDYQEGDVVLDTSGFQAAARGSFALEHGIAEGRETLSIVYAPVPEPATYALTGLGLAALLVRRRAHRRA